MFPIISIARFDEIGRGATFRSSSIFNSFPDLIERVNFVNKIINTMFPTTTQDPQTFRGWGKRFDLYKFLTFFLP